MTKLFLSKKEFSEAAGISLRTTDNLIAAKELSVRRIGKRVLISVAEAEKFARRDHRTQQERKENDSAGQSPRIQPQS